MNYKLIAFIPVTGVILGFLACHRMISSSSVQTIKEEMTSPLGMGKEIPLAATVPIADMVVEASDLPVAQTTTSFSGVFDPHSLQKDDRIYMNLEALFWQSNMGSLSFGVESDSSSSVQNGNCKSPSFDWKWGYRLGMGYRIPHDRWDLFANYTYLYGSAHGHAGKDSRVVFPRWATNFAGKSPFYADSSKADWNVHLNMGDLELGRTCFPSKWLSLRPFVGLRGGTIDQKYTVAYNGGTIAPSDSDKLDLNTDFWGVGLRMGVNTLWGLGSGISIYGNGSTSLLSGHFTVHEREKLIWQELQKMKLESQVNNVVVEADVALGLQWDYLFSKERYHIGLKMGWEFDIYFNQNQLFHFTSTNPGSFQTQSDDLSFQGLTVGFRFDF